MMMKVGFVSLGCSKNLVDTEMLIGLFKKNCNEIVNEPKDAEIIVINTCGFIESAKQEAIDTILEMSKYKNTKCKYLIVMGCLIERYKDELIKEMPEVDLFIKYSEYSNIWEQIENIINKEKNNSGTKSYEEKNQLDFMGREITTGKNFAYLRIAEGCSNKCTYCAIPYIRGPFVSRKFEDIIEEAKQLVKSGIKELIVIAQDTTKYGIDIYGKPRLSELLQELCKINNLEWIRFLYAYPETITDELIKTVKENDKICKYFDIPIQHISDTILKRMNRKSNSKSIRNVIDKIRKEIPNVILRTTVIVGFPGETQKDFEELYNFIQEVKFDRLGAFKYSKEEGTPAEKLPNQIHHNTKKSRYNKIMTIQQIISMQKQESYIGKKYKILVESKSFDEKWYLGRSCMDVPEIDGIIYLKSNEDDTDNLKNKFVDCKIVDVNGYDLIAEIEN
ncbi:MAG TPA: 30S ribosomal protein S12 methylthiotransferase RimO [Clostridia bacterium]|nr:30S ribosomal protein S12 methylthiotransferase RimO [Clostridia bacterium]